MLQTNGSRSLWWILAAHALLLLFIWFQHGLLLDKEALKYTGSAETILRGDLANGFHYLHYSAFVLFLVPFLALGAPAFAVAAQIVLGVLAAFALRRTVLALDGTILQANAAFAAFLLLYPLQTWTLALYSESFFVSASMLFLAETMRPKRTWWGMAVGALVVIFARPVGILFVAPMLAWVAAKEFAWPNGRTIGAASVTVLLAVLFLPILDASLLGIVVEGHAIGGFPTYPGNGAAFHGTSLASAEMKLIADHGPGAWCVLAIERTGWLLFAGRPYYSALHNALMAPVALLYPFALLTLIRRWRSGFVKALAAGLLLNILVVALTFAEWNGRFLVPMLPVWILLAALGLPTGPRKWVTF